MFGDTKIIDVDVHNQLTSAKDLLPYLPEPWKTRVAKAGVGMPDRGYPTPIGVLRKDCAPPGGGPAASDPEFLVQDLIEPFKIEYAILTGHMMDVSTLPEPDYAAAIASAWNDFMVEHWLPKHPSFRATIVVSSLDSALAVREIERMADHPQMVGIVMGSGQRALFGERQYHPLYEAAERLGLPISIHPGGEGAGPIPPPSAAGYPTRYLEYHTGLSQNYMAHLTSLVCEGVFEKFPNLKFVALEGGIAWLPHLMWQLDKNYKALRATVPWLKKLPSQYIRDNCLFSTQPIEEPDDPKQLLALFDMIDAENFLLFSSDYPHWDNDIPTEILKRLSPDARQKIFYDNAKTLYRL
ncbi:MAG: amidohydrolase [Paenibacillus sp.]|jgi:predicted TIM-barrel fold metal-dependent hydrolase|nr:amidohydrolase [Paenibacillus sp.]